MPPQFDDDDDVGHCHDNDRNEEQDHGDGRIVKLPVPNINRSEIRLELKRGHVVPGVVTPDLDVVQPPANVLLAEDEHRTGSGD